jgi:hypothetical protein
MHLSDRRHRPFAALAAAAVLWIALPAAAAQITDVRVGVHPKFTRIVFELDGRAGYQVERAGTDAAPEIRITIDAVSSAREVRASGDVRGVKVDAGTKARAHITLRDPGLRVREMMLTDPPRIVLDLVKPETAIAAAEKPAAERPAAALAAKPKPKAKAPAKPEPKEIAKPEATQTAKAAPKEAAKPEAKATAKPEEKQIAKAEVPQKPQPPAPEPKVVPAPPPAPVAPKAAVAPPAPTPPKAAPPVPAPVAPKTAAAPTPVPNETAPTPTPALTPAPRVAPAPAVPEQSAKPALPPAIEPVKPAAPPAIAPPKPAPDSEHATAPAPPAPIAPPPAVIPAPAPTPTPESVAKPPEPIAPAPAPTHPTPTPAPAPHVTPPASPMAGASWSDHLRDPIWLGGGAVVVLCLAAIGVVIRRRRALPNDLDVTAIAEEIAQSSDSPGRIPSGGFAMGDDDRTAAEPESTLAGLFDAPVEKSAPARPVFPVRPPSTARPAPMFEPAAPVEPAAAENSLFDDAGEMPGEPDVSEGDAPMNTEMDLPADRRMTQPAARMGGSAAPAPSPDVTRLLQDLERRIATLEARLDESNEAREKLERQVAAQSEELRVQRAAIARTQRALRTMTRGDEDKATEPALRDGDTQAKTRVTP